MCRLFALSGGRKPLRATFWLLEAPDALVRQSRRNPDGYGLATFEPDRSPDVDKRPAAAYRDTLFAREAREEESTTFVAHVRFASRGRKTLENTHPFEQRGRVFAHTALSMGRGGQRSPLQSLHHGPARRAHRSCQGPAP